MCPPVMACTRLGTYGAGNRPLLAGFVRLLYSVAMNASISESVDPAMLRRIQELRLMDDDFMTVVFSGDNEATEFLLRILLSRDDLKVKSSMTQKEKRNLFGRSVRLDIVAEAGKTYNVEVQRADKGASPRRVRYNLAMLDSHTLKKNDDFSALPETYIIFITENDYAGQGKPFYKVKKCFEDTAAEGKRDLPFDDGCTILYVNGEYYGVWETCPRLRTTCITDSWRSGYDFTSSRARG